MEELFEVVEVNEDPNVKWCCIFNTFNYYKLHRTESAYYFVLRDKISNEVAGVCHFTGIGEGIFISPYRGTYAGLELHKNNLYLLDFFLKKLESLLKEKGAKKIVISAAPFHHNQTFAAHLFNTAFNLGYKIEGHDLNYAIAVDENEMIEKMHYNNKKRVKKCIREGYTFKQAQTPEEWEVVYNVIAANRISKGYNLSMTFEQIIQMQELFADSIFFFMATAGDICVGGSICIKISDHILYVFYWGDVPGYEQYSPITFLATGIYRFARENNFTLLDVGGSTLKGIPMYGLIKFKEGLGFDVSLKLRFEKAV